MKILCLSFEYPARWPHRQLVRNDVSAKEHVAKWFALKNDEPIRLHLAGNGVSAGGAAAFAGHPLAQTSSYRVLAEQVGAESLRAVGNGGWAKPHHL